MKFPGWTTVLSVV